MISKSTLSALAVVGLGVAGLVVAAWNQSSQAQGQQAAGERPRAAAVETDEARQQEKNFRDILLAATYYANGFGCYPPPAIYGDGNWPLLSWRVALLPYLGQNELYQQFHLNEPWDSPHNKTLIDRMPAIFETPASPAPRGYTRFRGFAGKGTVFDPTPKPDTGPMGHGGMMGGMGAEMMMGGMGAMNGRGQGEKMAGMMAGMMSDRGMMGGYGGMNGMMGANKGQDRRTQRGAGQRADRPEEPQGAAERQEQKGAQGSAEPQGQPQEGAGQRADRPDEHPGAGEPAGAEGAMGGMMAMMGAAPRTPGRKGVEAAEITDGTGYTVFAVVARDATPWTKPGELPFVPDQELPALDDHDPRGYMLGMCLGSVRLLKKDHPSLPMILAALITRDGGEIISSDVFADAEPQADAAPAAGAAGSFARTTVAAPSVEDRLRAVEEKLDRLIERLDAR